MLDFQNINAAAETATSISLGSSSRKRKSAPRQQGRGPGASSASGALDDPNLGPDVGAANFNGSFEWGNRLGEFDDYSPDVGVGVGVDAVDHTHSDDDDDNIDLFAQLFSPAMADEAGPTSDAQAQASTAAAAAAAAQEAAEESQPRHPNNLIAVKTEEERKDSRKKRKLQAYTASLSVAMLDGHVIDLVSDDDGGAPAPATSSAHARAKAVAVAKPKMQPSITRPPSQRLDSGFRSTSIFAESTVWAGPIPIIRRDDRNARVLVSCKAMRQHSMHNGIVPSCFVVLVLLDWMPGSFYVEKCPGSHILLPLPCAQQLRDGPEVREEHADKPAG